MHIPFAASERSTIGVEWELALVDQDSGDLRQVAQTVLDAVAPGNGEDHPHIKQELLLNTVEVVSGVCRTVGEAGATAVDDPLTGHAVAAFVVPSGAVTVDAAQLRGQVAQQIGPVAKPKHLYVVRELPKTRSGKILRRLLAQLWEADRDRRAGRDPDPLGDTTSLQNPWTVHEIADVLASA